MGIRRVAGLAWNRLLMRVDNSMERARLVWTSLAAKFTKCAVLAVRELGGKLLNSFVEYWRFFTAYV
jgi:hypothetical protein